MTGARRRSRITALLTVAALFLGACAAPGPEAALEPGPSLSPAPRESYLALGARLLAGNEAALAMRAFTASLSVEGITPEALTGAGIAAQRQGMLGTARQHLEHARALAPNSVAAHQNLGMVLMMQRDYHGARTAFRSALLLSGDGPNEASRKGLESAEIAIAALEAGRHPDPAATQRVVRLGTDAFRIAERTDIGTEDAAAAEELAEQAWAAEEMEATTETGADLAAAGASGGAIGGGSGDRSGDKTGPETAAAAGGGSGTGSGNRPGNGLGAEPETEAGTGVAALVTGEAGNEAD